MLFTGKELLAILGRTPDCIELRNEHGRCCRVLSTAEALELDPDLFVGIGNRKRIKFIRPASQIAKLNAGSLTTVRITDTSGRYFTGKQILKHRSSRV